MTNHLLPINASLRSPSKGSAARWLWLVLGEEESRKAMQLPEEIRKNLYSEILAYGPAVNQISAFIEALRKAPGKDAVWLMLTWVDEDSKFKKPTLLPFMEKVQNVSIHDLIQQWVGFNDLSSIEAQFQEATAGGVARSYSARNGASLVMLLLTGQYLFPSAKDGLLSQVEAVVPPTNEILAHLGLPLLAGVFAEGTTK